MPTTTYTALANITLSAPATGISFASIPSGYTHLVAVVQADAASTSTALRVTLNSSSTNIYSRQRITADGTSVSAGTITDTTQFVVSSAADATSTDGFQSVINFFDYSATNKHKMVLMKSDNASLGTDAIIGRWASTTAVTSIQIFGTLNLAAGSTFALYGIVA